MILISRKRIKRERSTPNGAISRLYTSSKQMKPANYHLRTQLAIATSPTIGLSAYEKNGSFAPKITNARTQTVQARQKSI